MSSLSHSLSEKWLPELKAGNPNALAEIWRRYFGNIASVARRSLQRRHVPMRVEDDEDVALSVLRRLNEIVGGAQLDQIDHREDLWALLVTITSGKVTDLIRRQTADKRGEGKVRGESAFEKAGDVDGLRGIQDVLGNDLTPDSELIVTEETDRLLGLITDPDTRTVLELFLQGYSKTDVSEELKISRQSVHRKLDLVKALWAKEITR